jgi:DNA-directed RNA polymerase subunit RPC12/RpoP
VPEYVEREFRRYLDCGILARGLARARCGQCGHDFLIAFSCNGRAVCPSCNARRIVATAAHPTDHVLPDLPVRQWQSRPREEFVQRDIGNYPSLLGPRRAGEQHSKDQDDCSKPCRHDGPSFEQFDEARPLQ